MSAYKMLTAKEVAGLFECSESQAYKIIRKLNNELEAKGYLTPLRGRVSEAYLRERYYAMDRETTEGG